MLNRRTILTLIIALSSGLSTLSAFAEPGTPVAIAIHAGAGTISKEELTASMELEIRGALMQAGHKVLSSGGSSLDVEGNLEVRIYKDE